MKSFVVLFGALFMSLSAQAAVCSDAKGVILIFEGTSLRAICQKSDGDQGKGNLEICGKDLFQTLSFGKTNETGLSTFRSIETGVMITASSTSKKMSVMFDKDYAVVAHQGSKIIRVSAGNYPFMCK